VGITVHTLSLLKGIYDVVLGAGENKVTALEKKLKSCLLLDVCGTGWLLCEAVVSSYLLVFRSITHVYL